MVVQIDAKEVPVVLLDLDLVEDIRELVGGGPITTKLAVLVRVDVFGRLGAELVLLGSGDEAAIVVGGTEVGGVDRADEDDVEGPTVLEVGSDPSLSVCGCEVGLLLVVDEPEGVEKIVTGIGKREGKLSNEDRPGKFEITTDGIEGMGEVSRRLRVSIETDWEETEFKEVVGDSADVFVN
ncbi:hypothetical protein NLJ89_g9595 [Agrocybe chaxingu]|uniref:Uncharacterized protein n=1 Tax=Agrocybe chaxingu TaxID=84603 RepID=A0A9W8MR25_9AGAR|nr:hypothetical protein NLJ89_g9595 [Agrocybe chaxingu]